MIGRCGSIADALAGPASARCEKGRGGGGVLCKRVPSGSKGWSEKWITYRYEAGENTGSALWVEVRWSVKRELYTAFRSNAVDDGEVWVPFERSVRNHAVCKRMAFEQLAWMTVPLATVHQTETIDV